MCDESSRENVRRCGRKNAVGKTKLFWKDTKIYRSKDVPWRIKCQRLVDHVYAVFPLEVKLGRGQQTQEKKVGDKNNDEAVQAEKRKRKDVG